ncbi:MAG: hypothetical protein ACOC4F_01580 [bacterium]
MLGSSFVRFLFVLSVMVIVGFGWYPIGLSRLKKKGVDEAAAKKQAKLAAKKYAIIAAFIYMVAMVSVAGLFV